MFSTPVGSGATNLNFQETAGTESEAGQDGVDKGPLLGLAYTRWDET